MHFNCDRLYQLYPIVVYCESDTKETIYLHQPRLLYLEPVLPNPSHKQCADWYHNVWWWPQTGNDEHVVVAHRMHFPNGWSSASFLLHPIPSHANSRPIHQGTEMPGSSTNKTWQRSWNRRVCRFGWAETPQMVISKRPQCIEACHAILQDKTCFERNEIINMYSIYHL